MHPTWNAAYAGEPVSHFLEDFGDGGLGLGSGEPHYIQNVQVIALYY